MRVHFYPPLVALAWGIVASAQAQTATPAQTPAPVSNSGVHVMKLTNSDKNGISAVYVSPAGSSDMSDDLLGKQVADPGKTVNLKVKDPQGTCTFDLTFLLNSGKTVVKKDLNLCQTTAYSFTP